MEVPSRSAYSRSCWCNGLGSRTLKVFMSRRIRSFAWRSCSATAAIILCRDFRRQSHQLIVPIPDFRWLVRKLATLDDQFLAFAPVLWQLVQGLDLAFFQDSADHWSPFR